MKVKLLTPEMAQESECYVLRHPEAKLCHLPSWSKVIKKVSGHNVYYLVAFNETGVHGILPLTYARSALFGKRMVSQGFSNYGGILSDSEQIRDSLYEKALELVNELNCPTIEFRSAEPLPYPLHVQTDKICMYLPLEKDPQKLWDSFDPKVRNQIRKAMKSDLTDVNGREELLREFYDVYTVRMKQLGTPAYSRKLMRSLLVEYPGNSRIFVVRLKDKTVGAGFTLCYNGFVEIPWAATLTEYNKLCPNNLLYWSVMEYYCRRGAACFDFGRCAVDSPTYRFKKQWGSEPKQLYYCHWVRPGLEMNFMRPDNERYRKKVEMWKRLPLAFTRLLGPYISRDLV